VSAGVEGTPTLIPERFNAASFFVDRHVAEGRGERVAFHHEGGTLTYAGLQERANRAGNALQALGVEREQRVLCLLLDTPDFLAAFWGALKIGAIPVPLNTMLRAPDYLYFLNDSRATVLVVSEPLFAVVEPVLGEARFLRHVIVTGPAKGRAQSFEALLDKASARLDAARGRPRDDQRRQFLTQPRVDFRKKRVHVLEMPEHAADGDTRALGHLLRRRTRAALADQLEQRGHHRLAAPHRALGASVDRRSGHLCCTRSL